VLDALGGYLLLGAKLLQASPAAAIPYCDAFNFGPNVDSNKSVRDLVEKIITYWGNGSWSDISSGHAPHEASLLSISIDKAYHVLGWRPKLPFDETIRQTVEWYKAFLQAPSTLRDLTLQQIIRYQNGQDKTVEDPIRGTVPLET